MKKKLIISIIIIVVVAIIAGALVWLYSGKFTDAKVGVFKKTSLPAAVVDGSLVSGKDLAIRYELAKSLFGKEEDFNPVEVQNQIYNQLIDTKKLESIASERNISISGSELDKEYHNLIDQVSGGDENQFKDELKATYGLEVDEFKNTVLLSDLLQSRVAVWFNQQESLNQPTYAKAHELQAKLDSGTSFDDVAKDYTADEATKDFAGDSGFVSVQDLLPEFQEALNGVGPNTTKLIPSRYGLHIFRILEKDSGGENGAERVHIQQIFVKNDTYETWYRDEAGKLKVTKFLKLS
jgi:foldase protein PrsA